MKPLLDAPHSPKAWLEAANGADAPLGALRQLVQRQTEQALRTGKYVDDEGGVIYLPRNAFQGAVEGTSFTQDLSAFNPEDLYNGRLNQLLFKKGDPLQAVATQQGFNVSQSKRRRTPMLPLLMDPMLSNMLSVCCPSFLPLLLLLLVLLLFQQTCCMVVWYDVEGGPGGLYEEGAPGLVEDV